jgi:hypothetical protein
LGESIKVLKSQIKRKERIKRRKKSKRKSKRRKGRRGSKRRGSKRRKKSKRFNAQGGGGSTSKAPWNRWPFSILENNRRAKLKKEFIEAAKQGDKVKVIELLKMVDVDSKDSPRGDRDTALISKKHTMSLYCPNCQGSRRD